MQNEKAEFTELEILRNELNTLNERLAQVEAALEKMQTEGFQPEKNTIAQPGEDFEVNFPFQSKGSIEFSVGEYGMAWLGNIILFFGIVFLTGYLQKTGSPFISGLAGIITLSGIYAGSYFIRNSNTYLSKLLTYNGHLLLYYIAVRLHFFQESPLIKNELVGILILIVVSFSILYIAYREKKEFLAGLALVMLLTTGIISNAIAFSAGIIALISALAVYFYFRFGWLKLAFVFIFLLYIAHLNWLLNFPLLGNSPELVASPGAGYLFFIAIGFIFSLIALIPKKEEISNDFIVASIVWNGLGFTFLLALIIVTYFLKNYVPIMASVTLFCLIYAVILKIKSQIKITASMYVLYGFMALSVAIYGIFGLPDSYTLFALQSLLVVSMALWFQSRFMITMNTFLFLMFMGIYLKEPVGSNISNFTFMMVALVSARIINWKKERLNIKTEIVRNVYLIAGFAMTLIAFHHAFPEKYITASWIMAAILFFVMSVLIKNIKYRWVAIASMIASAIRLIFVDMSNINIGYRVLIFLSLAIISLTISILYNRYLHKKSNQPD